MGVCKTNKETMEASWCDTHGRGFLMCEKIRLEDRVQDLEHQNAQLRIQINRLSEKKEDALNDPR